MCNGLRLRTLPDMKRKNLRLPYYDYSQTGAYFITIVTYKRKCLFGTVIDGKMILNDAGKMIDSVCQELPQFIPDVIIKSYVIMPNHFHAIVVIGINSLRVDTEVCPEGLNGQPHGRQQRDVLINENLGRPSVVAPKDFNNNRTHRISLSDVVARFKSLTTRRYIDGVEKYNWPRFETHLWQRSYYEHVIRDERDYESIVDYISSNPEKWEKDKEYIK